MFANVSARWSWLIMEILCCSIRMTLSPLYLGFNIEIIKKTLGTDASQLSTWLTFSNQWNVNFVFTIDFTLMSTKAWFNPEVEGEIIQRDSQDICQRWRVFDSRRKFHPNLEKNVWLSFTSENKAQEILMFNLHYCFFHLLPHLVAHLLYSQSGMQSRRLILWGEILFCFNEKTNKGILFQKNPRCGSWRSNSI